MGSVLGGAAAGADEILMPLGDEDDELMEEPDLDLGGDDEEGGGDDDLEGM